MIESLYLIGVPEGEAAAVARAVMQVRAALGGPRESAFTVLADVNALASDEEPEAILLGASDDPDVLAQCAAELEALGCDLDQFEEDEAQPESETEVSDADLVFFAGKLALNLLHGCGGPQKALETAQRLALLTGDQDYIRAANFLIHAFR